jgi:hypothetical protein
MTRGAVTIWISASFVASIPFIACSSPQAGSPGSGDDGGNPSSGDDGTSTGSSSAGSGAAGSSGTGAGTGGSSGAGASSGAGVSSGASGSSGLSASSGASGSSGVGASSGIDAGGSSGVHGSSGVDAGHAEAGVGSSSGSSSGTTSAACTWSGALQYNGNASFTCYYFGQGPKQTASGYKSACGYNVTETTGGSGNNCGQSASDTADNTANTGLAKSTYFAAIPGDSNGGFSNVVHCGECAELTNPGSGHSVIVTIIDECPVNGGQNSPCASAGHLDVSMQAFNALDYSIGDPSGTTWKSVPCPVTGTIKAVLNAGIASQVYFQNMVYPLKSVSNATQSQYGYWQFSGGGAGGPAALTDVEGHTVTATIPSGGGDMGVQFPSPGTCN